MRALALGVVVSLLPAFGGCAASIDSPSDNTEATSVQHELGSVGTPTGPSGPDEGTETAHRNILSGAPGPTAGASDHYDPSPVPWHPPSSGNSNGGSGNGKDPSNPHSKIRDSLQPDNGHP
jgi:hypothetical protein